MDEGVLAMFWLMVLSVGILITIVYLRKFSNQERLSMIEKGVNPADKATVRNNQPIWPVLWQTPARSAPHRGGTVGFPAGRCLSAS